jgi:large subunit ribosomal protein L3
MKYLIGQKQHMTQVFDDKGTVYPVTVLSVAPMTVTMVKTPKRDKYDAVQVGTGTRRVKNISKAVRGHLKLDKDAKTGARFIREYRGGEEMAVGQTIDASIFSEGETVRVTSISKGRGFQGVVKRHGFAGGSRTHGQKHSEREPGAIGGGARAGGRVAKGIRMAGRMGSDRITVRNLKVIKIDTEGGQIMISGAIPGRRGSLVEIVSNS